MEPTVDPAQSNPSANPSVESSQMEQQPVTAAGTPPVDNATPPVNPQGTPQTAGEHATAAVVDDEPMDAYEAEKLAFLAATPPGPQKSALEMMASPADLAAQGIVPGATEAPPAPVAPVPAPTPTPVPVTATPPVPEDDLNPGDGKNPRFRVRAQSNVDVRALAAFKEAEKSGTLGDKDMVTFMAEFAAKSATPAAPAAPAPNEPARSDVTPAADATPRTLAEADALLAQLKQQRYDAMQNFDFAEAGKIEDQEHALRAQRDSLRDAEAQQQQQRQETMAASDTAALAKAAQMFPDSTNPESALAVAMSEIFFGWEASGDARAKAENRYLYAYIDAAEALGIQPQAAGAAPATQPAPTPSVQPSSPTAPVHRPPVATLLVSGGARDISRVTVSDKVDDYERERDQFLGRRAA